MTFDQQFYETFWPSIHHHDYAIWADVFCSRYDQLASVLDIGCGCGYLVGVLRERGIEAWGIEISQYALDNQDSQSSLYVINGDFRSIPFEDNKFDLVMSRGVLQYLPEADLPTALSEAKRVGRHQVHTVDSDPDPYAVTREPYEFWQQLFESHDFQNEWF